MSSYFILFGMMAVISVVKSLIDLDERESRIINIMDAK